MKQILYCRSYIYYKHIGNIVRHYSVPVNKVQKSKCKAQSTPFNIPEDLINYFSSCKTFNDYKDVIPKKLLIKKPKQPEYLYLMDENVATDIVDSIKDDILSNEAPVLECCPGFGLVTNQLRKAGVRSIRLFEVDPFFKEFALNMVSESTGEIQHYPNNLLHLWKITYQDIMDNGGRLKTLLDGINVKKWRDKPVLNFISVLTNSIFIRHIVFSIIFHNGILAYGRPQLFLLLPPHVFLQLREDKDCGRYQNRTFTTLCSIFFDFQFYRTVDRSTFLPWQKTSTKVEKMCETYNLDINSLYLVKLVPKINLHDTVKQKSLKMLWFFVKHHSSHQKNRIIPMMEQWVPGCGPRLINKGYGIFTQFSDLSSQQMLQLFLDFTQWPEFQSCSFIPAMESTTMKMVTPSDLEMNTDSCLNDDLQSDAGRD